MKDTMTYAIYYVVPEKRSVHIVGFSIGREKRNLITHELEIFREINHLPGNITATT